MATRRAWAELSFHACTVPAKAQATRPSNAFTSGSGFIDIFHLMTNYFVC
jgi:hypothetical protein